VTRVLSASNKHLGWMSFALVLAITWGGLWMLGWGLEKSQPVQTVVGNVVVLDAPAGTKERTLRVEFNAPPPGNCVKLSQHLLHRIGPGTAILYPLGSSMSGEGFRSPTGEMMQVLPLRVVPQDYVQMLSIPASIPDGRYEYVYRSMYTCLWLGGLVVRRIMYEAPPIPVRIGPP
jgi:hypothetical protein